MGKTLLLASANLSPESFIGGRPHPCGRCPPPFAEGVAGHSGGIRIGCKSSPVDEGPDAVPG